MMKRFKRFFVLTTLAALMLQFVPGVNLGVEKAKAEREKNTVASAIDKTSSSYNLNLTDLTKLDSGDVNSYETDGIWAKSVENFNPNEYVEFVFNPELTGEMYKVSVLSQLMINSGAGNYYDKWQYSVDGVTWNNLTWVTPSVDDIEVDSVMPIGNLTADEINNLKIRYSAYVNSTNSVHTFFNQVRLQYEEIDITAPLMVQNVYYNIDSDNILTLTWDKNAEADLAGYKIYSDDQTGTIESEPIASLDIDENVWSYQLDKVGTYTFGITAFDMAGNESEMNIGQIKNKTANFSLGANTVQIISNNLEVTSLGLGGNLEVTDLGTDNVEPSIQNSVQAFGHYWSFNADDNADLEAIFPVKLKFYFTQKDLNDAGLTSAKQLVGAYYYNSIDKQWKLYSSTGVVEEKGLFNNQQFDGYVWVDADHFTPVVQGADIVSPESNISALTEYELSRVFEVSYTATDEGDSKLDYTELYYRVDGGVWQKYVTTDNAEGKFISSPISFTAEFDGKYEFYTVSTDKAGNIEKNSVDSNGIIVADAQTIIDTAYPASVTGLIVTVGDGRVVLSWNMVSNADGYIVKYLDKTVDVGKNNQTTIIGLQNGKSYEFSVVAYRNIGSRKSETTTISAIPVAPAKVAGPAVVAEVQATEASEETVVPTPEPKSTISVPNVDEEITPSTDDGQVKGDDTTSETKDWTGVIVVLSILVILAAAVAGYYGYEWWASKPKTKKKTNTKPKPNKGIGKGNRW
ncbi:MAG: fibronectin type III domain-containing protein [Patescibacteria group bacterium]|jgi:hypothetical protein